MPGTHLTTNMALTTFLSLNNKAVKISYKTPSDVFDKTVIKSLEGKTQGDQTAMLFYGSSGSHESIVIALDTLNEHDDAFVYKAINCSGITKNGVCSEGKKLF